MTGLLRGFGRFWYDFIVGDDWKIAAAVVAGLVVTLALVVLGALSGAAATVLGGVAILVAFTASMVIDVRR
jgi:hypothetical protein